MSNTLYVAATVVVAIGVLWGGIWALLRLSYRRGGTEREYKIALEQNTESNKALTGTIGKLADKLNEHDRRFDHVEWRLDNLEAPTHVSVSVGNTPHRDASPG